MTICFDLDNTLCRTQGGDYEKSLPIKCRIDIVNELARDNHIIIDTARGSVTKKNWKKLTKKQLKEWGVKYNELRVGKKVYADFYVDDKAINSEDFYEKIINRNRRQNINQMVRGKRVCECFRRG